MISPLDAHDSAVRRVLDRVGEQVRDDLGDPGAVAQGHHGLGSARELEPVRRALPRERGHGLREQLGDGEGRAGEHHLVLLDRLEVQEVVDQGGLPDARFPDDADQFPGPGRRGTEGGTQFGALRHATDHPPGRAGGGRGRVGVRNGKSR